MKIIDFEIKGNQVKFYVGSDNCNNYYGDDWDDRPYEHNADKVYDRFILGYFVKTFDFDDVVMEPCSGHSNSNWCKNDMRERKVPCICVLPKEYKEEYTWYYSFEDISNNENTIKFYFGDKIDETIENVIMLKNLQEDNHYIEISCENDNKLIRGTIHMFIESLKYASNNKYLDEFDEEMFSHIKNIKEKQFKNYFIKLLKENIKFYKYNLYIDDFIETIDLKIVDDKYIGNKEKYRYRICYLSNDNFKIGELKISPIYRY